MFHKTLPLLLLLGLASAVPIKLTTSDGTVILIIPKDRPSDFPEKASGLIEISVNPSDMKPFKEDEANPIIMNDFETVSLPLAPVDQYPNNPHFPMFPGDLPQIPPAQQYPFQPQGSPSYQSSGQQHIPQTFGGIEYFKPSNLQGERPQQNPFQHQQPLLSLQIPNKNQNY